MNTYLLFSLILRRSAFISASCCVFLPNPIGDSFCCSCIAEPIHSWGLISSSHSGSFPGARLSSQTLSTTPERMPVFRSSPTPSPGVHPPTSVSSICTQNLKSRNLMWEKGCKNIDEVFIFFQASYVKKYLSDFTGFQIFNSSILSLWKLSFWVIFIYNFNTDEHI